MNHYCWKNTKNNQYCENTKNNHPPSEILRQNRDQRRVVCANHARRGSSQLLLTYCWTRFCSILARSAYVLSLIRYDKEIPSASTIFRFLLLTSIVMMSVPFKLIVYCESFGKTLHCSKLYPTQWQQLILSTTDQHFWNDVYFSTTTEIKLSFKIQGIALLQTHPTSPVLCSTRIYSFFCAALVMHGNDPKGRTR